jgi:hypothetical protein
MISYPLVLVASLCLVELVDMEDSMASVAFQIDNRLACALGAFGHLDILGRSTSCQLTPYSFLIFSQLLLREVDCGLSSVTATALEFPI